MPLPQPPLQFRNQSVLLKGKGRRSFFDSVTIDQWTFQNYASQFLDGPTCDFNKLKQVIQWYTEDLDWVAGTCVAELKSYVGNLKNFYKSKSFAELTDLVREQSAQTPQTQIIAHGDNFIGTFFGNVNAHGGPSVPFEALDSSGNPLSPILAYDDENESRLQQNESEVIKHDTSFTSDDYHASRKYLYTFEDIKPWHDDDTPWVVSGLDVTEELRSFRETSVLLNSGQGNLKDSRILSLYSIFPLSIDIQSSVSKYMGQMKHDLLCSQLLDLINKLAITTSNNLLIWTNSLTNETRSWTEVTKKCINILNEAERSEDSFDLIAATVIFNLAPRLTRTTVDDPCEDTFIHLYLDNLLDIIFSTEPILQQE
ncbi:hypothetical protein DFQ28_001118, partial [Apophysomyces sp. BC1034]